MAHHGSPWLREEHMATSLTTSKLRTCNLWCTPDIIHSPSDNLQNSRPCRCRLIRYFLITSGEHDICLPANTWRYDDTISTQDWGSRHKDRACNAHEGAEKCASGLAARIGKHVAGGLENDRRVGCNRAGGIHGKAGEGFNAKGDERVGFRTGDKEGNREGINYGDISRKIACATRMESGIYLGQSPTTYQRELGRAPRTARCEGKNCDGPRL